MSWNELPDKLKVKCIESLDFKSRTSLQSSSKTERKLVDSVTYRFSKVTCGIFPKYSDFDVIASNASPVRSEMIYVEYKKGFYKAPNCTAYLSSNRKAFNKLVNFLKLVLHAKIDKFDLHIHPDDKDDKDQRLIAELIAAGPPLHVTELDVELTPPMELTMAVLRKCEEHVLAELVISEMKDVELTAELLEMVLKANVVSFKDGSKMAASTVMKIVKKWEETGEEADKEVTIWKSPIGLFVELAKGLEGKIVEREEHTIRIQTAHPTKHIWIFESGNTIHLFNVPAEMGEPDMKAIKGMDRMEKLQNINDMLGMLNLWAGGDAEQMMQQLMNSMNF